jgi:hypothetical protein
MNTIRCLVPVKNILRECLPSGADEVDHDSDSDSEDEAEVEAEPEHKEEPVEAPVEEATVPPVEEHVEVAAEATPKALEENTTTSPTEEITTPPNSPDIEAKAESVAETQPEPTILTIDDDASVKFAEYDSVFDGEDSGLVFDSRMGEIVGGELIIDEESSAPLDDIVELDESGNVKMAPVETLGDDDFDTLN